jgi:hypothetical protein
MTAGPSEGPASAYPTLSKPASIYFIELNDVFSAGLSVDISEAVSLAASAFAEVSNPNIQVSELEHHPELCEVACEVTTKHSLQRSHPHQLGDGKRKLFPTAVTSATRGPAPAS